MVATYNLDNYRPVTNDEVELIAVGYKLATQGVLGSDLYAGFFGAERHFFITLPLQHVLEAISFKLLGAGVFQARVVSVVAGMGVVWLLGLLAFRWFGVFAALVCEVLLVVWASNITGAANGLALLGVSRTARYDVLAVLAGWLAIAALYVTLRRPRASSALALGACCGLAALSQFMGTFVLPLVVLNWLVARAPARLLAWVLVGFALVFGPWLVYGALNASDVAGQLSVYAGRGDFLRPGFYVENVEQEAGRYEHLLVQPGASQLLLLLGVWPAGVYAIVRSFGRRASLPDRLVWTSLLTFAGGLLVLDHGKSSVYAIVLLPSICLALSRLVSAFVPLGVLVLVLVCFEGLGAYQLTLQQAQQVTPYARVGQQIEAALVPGAHVFGPERWWWAVHEHPYLSLRSVWWQWGIGGGPDLSEADAIIVNDNVRADILLFPESVQTRFWSFVNVCTERVAALDDATYFGIDVYRVPAQMPPRCLFERKS